MSAADASDTVEFWTLGSFALRRNDGRDLARVLARPKCLAILAYLAVGTRSHLHSRDTLLALFWPELDGEHARLALRQTLHVLREKLGLDLIVTRGPSLIGLAPTRIWCDVAAFEDALAVRDFARALELYRGDFLAGMFIPGAPEFERWLDRERARLRAKAVSAAWWMAEEMEAVGAVAHAVFWANRAVDIAPDDEQGVRSLVRLLDRCGDSARALRAYERFERWLAREFGAGPSVETRALVRSVRERARPALVDDGSSIDAVRAPGRPLATS